MNKKALYSLSYGVFVLAGKAGGKVNACITNTCMQVLVMQALTLPPALPARTKTP